MTPADNRSARKELAAAFRAYRTELAEAFFQAVKEAENSAGFLPQSMAELHEWWRAALLIIVDLGREWLKQPDDLQRDLFSGWIAALNHPYMHPPEAQEFSIRQDPRTGTAAMVGISRPARLRAGREDARRNFGPAGCFALPAPVQTPSRAVHRRLHQLRNPGESRRSMRSSASCDRLRPYEQPGSGDAAQ